MPLSKITNPFLDPAGAARSNVYSPSANTIGIVTSGLDRVRVNSSGDVGIGTASPSGLGGKVLQIDSASNYPELIFNRTGSGARKWGALIGNDGDYLIRDYTSSVNQFFIDTSGNLRFNSGYGSAATAYGCRAWIVFNGTGTVAIRASGNVSSITDNGTGDYTVNFTTAMPDINYSVGGNGAGTINSDSCGPAGFGNSTNYRSTTSLRFGYWYFTNNTLTDRDYINLQIFR
jgi:hypothetical protein